jgi:predicted TIM-barrel fold metal-dependent hydrolase
MPEHHRGDSGAIDVHQHLWLDEFVDRLRARSHTPYLRGWTLHTDGEPPYDVDEKAHDVATRIASDEEAGVTAACLSLSAPLGIESLRRPEAQPLIDVWHHGVRGLPGHFRAWVSTPAEDADIVGVSQLLSDERFIGLQVPATDLLTPLAWERKAQLLLAAELAGKPVFVHPGPEPRQALARSLPAWWAPVVGYTAQLQAAWWGWIAIGGRALFPRLKLVFAAGAGSAPVLFERHALRGGHRTAVDPDVYVDTSGTGERALEAVVRVLGIDALVLGSDSPYAEPLEEFLGEAATHAVRVTNPRRLLRPEPLRLGGEREWVAAS